MTRSSTTTAAADIERHPLWGVSLIHTSGGVTDLPVGWDDIRRDTEWVTTSLAQFGLGAGDFAVVVSLGTEAHMFRPFEGALQAMGAVGCASESWGFDAFRTAMFVANLPVRMVLGLNGDVVTGLAGKAGELQHHFGHVPHVLARPEAVPLLRDAGVRPYLCIPLGPTVAVECPARAGAHVNAEEWSVASADGEIHISTLGPRAATLEKLPTGVAGRMETQRCACGRDDPRIVPELVLDAVY